MINLFPFRYESLGSRRRDLSSSCPSSHSSSTAETVDASRSSSKKKPTKSSTLKSTKNTRHLELALKNKLSAPPSQDAVSQRYTRFPTGRSPRRHELSDQSSTTEPTHQLIVISSSANTATPTSAGHHHLHHHHHHHHPSNHRTMPKCKSTEATPTGQRARTGSSDLDRSGSFMNKPPRGWLHPDRQISDTGICYGVRYVGCLEVTTSMKSLDFETRSQIAKECINKVCESGGLKTVDKKRKVDKKILRMLGDKTNMDFAGSNVNLTITSRSLNLTIMETGEMIAEHDMPNVSFASGGDPDTLDFVAYVAKDHIYGRACFVLECGGGLAQDVITTVGQAFELRFKQYLNRGPVSNPEPLPRTLGAEQLPPMNDDPEYYNDLPGKMPPEVPAETKKIIKDIQSRELPPPNDTASAAASKTSETALKSTGNAKGATEKLKKGASADNLIDLNEEIRVPSKRIEPEYVNCDVIAKSKAQNQDEADGAKRSETSESDPFDLQPFEGTLPSSSLLKPLSPVRNNFSTNNSSGGFDAVESVEHASDGIQGQKQQLLQEIWYHGPISRKESECLVVTNGDFLVRESQGSPGQYVLTGMQGGFKKHLLLVDPEGVVRTKDRTFESVSHLINYHSKNGLPIIAADSALVLSKPIRMKT